MASPTTAEFGPSNEDVFEGDLTVDANTNMMIAGPITVPNITVNGNLSITNEVDITTGDLDIDTNGSLSIVNQDKYCMANIKLGGTVVASESGGTVTLDSGVAQASGFTLGSGVTFPAGMICKYEFQRTANTGSQTGSTTWTTVNGSSIAYTPQTGASHVFYQCRISRQHEDARVISGFQVKHDGTALDYSRFGDDFSSNTGDENMAGWSYFDTTIPAWTGSKTTLLEFRCYNDSYQNKLHWVEYWNPSDGGVMESGAFYTPTEVTMYSIM